MPASGHSSGKMAIPMTKDCQKTTANGSGWRKMKQIAENSMEKGNFTVDDLKKDLKTLRSSYK
jgi:hypothetical protein